MNEPKNFPGYYEVDKGLQKLGKSHNFIRFRFLSLRRTCNHQKFETKLTKVVSDEGEAEGLRKKQEGKHKESLISGTEHERTLNCQHDLLNKRNESQ